ncbi:MAG: YitT family protein [Vallitaleaceae bacterium]|nr:YitT family protein [Vallitaleaceae bacterium]
MPTLIFKRNPIWDYIRIILGTTLLAIAISLFFDPLGMVIGGVTGIAIIIKELTGNVMDGGIPIWISNLVINVPLFLLAIFVKGKSFGGKSFFATVYLSVALYFTQNLPVLTTDVLLGCIFGGVISGIGLGLVFSALATTGGTDLAASIIQHFIKYISIAKIMMFLDGAIILCGFFVFGPEKTMYAIISVYISVKVIDALLEGLYFAKAAFIITDHEDAIAQELLTQLERGLTGLNGEGMFTGNAKKVLLCVVSQRQIVQLKEIVKAIDKNAFVIVADVREVLGEGFIE